MTSRKQRHKTISISLVSRVIILVLSVAIFSAIIVPDYLSFMTQDVVELANDCEEESSEYSDKVEEFEVDDDDIHRLHDSSLCVKIALVNVNDDNFMLSHHREILTPPPEQL